MKLLIVEDDLNKRQQLRSVAEAAIHDLTVREEGSYRGGLKAILDWSPDVILLDMTLPTYDVTSTDSGGRTRMFGGRDVLVEMQRRGISSNVVLVTQFESFGEGNKRKTLAELSEELFLTFANAFRGTVYYHPAQSDWKAQLEAVLSEIVKR